MYRVNVQPVFMRWWSEPLWCSEGERKWPFALQYIWEALRFTRGKVFSIHFSALMHITGQLACIPATVRRSWATEVSWRDLIDERMHLDMLFLRDVFSLYTEFWGQLTVDAHGCLPWSFKSNHHRRHRHFGSCLDLQRLRKLGCSLFTDPLTAASCATASKSCRSNRSFLCSFP